MSTERSEAGLAVTREVLGAEHVDRALAGADSFSKGFQELATEFCWGRTWARGGRFVRRATFREELA